MAEKQCKLITNNEGAEYLVTRETSATATCSSSSDGWWSITVNKPGYTPKMFSGLIHVQSSRVVTAVETATLSDGYFFINGAARRHDTGGNTQFNVSVYVLWEKNQ